MKRSIFSLALMLAAMYSVRSQTLTLQGCLELARRNYPLIKQKDLIVRSKEFTIANAHAGYLPQVSINAQATYQSDVTKVPIDLPGLSIKPLSKDQYRIYAEINQNLYDGGTIRRTSDLQTSGSQVDDQRVEVELYSIKDRINQLYFGILLLNQQLDLNGLLRKDIQTSLTKAEASIQNGTALKMNAQILQAELLKVKQRDIESKASRKAFMDMLGMFVNEQLGDARQLSAPEFLTPVNVLTQLNRPELKLFNFQRQQISNQYLLTNTRNKPKLGLFVQGGYGRPGLNALQNDFSTYYLGGVRLSWNLSGFYNTGRDRQLMEVNTKMVDTQQDLFLFNTRMVLRQQSSEMNKLDELIGVDNEIIVLRSKILEAAKAQLDNGVISANDYLRELTAEDQAMQNKLLHEVQLQLARMNYQTTSGNNGQ